MCQDLCCIRAFWILKETSLVSHLMRQRVLTWGFVWWAQVLSCPLLTFVSFEESIWAFYYCSVGLSFLTAELFWKTGINLRQVNTARYFLECDSSPPPLNLQRLPWWQLLLCLYFPFECLRPCSRSWIHFNKSELRFLCGYSRELRRSPWQLCVFLYHLCHQQTWVDPTDHVLALEHREHVPLCYLSCLQDMNHIESNVQRLHSLLDQKDRRFPRGVSTYSRS